MTVRLICEALGVASHDEEDESLGPFLPPVVQLNAVEGVLQPGEEFTIRLRLRVRQIVPAPIQSGET